MSKWGQDHKELLVVLKENDSVILAWCEYWNRYARHWSTQEWSNGPQNANCVRIIIIISWTQEVPTGWILGPSKARTRLSDLPVCSVFYNEYRGLQDVARKSTARWLEVAFDLMRVVQRGPACKMWRYYFYYLNTVEVTTEPHKSQMYSHESLKVQNWTTWAQILGAKMRLGPRGIVSFTIGKLMIPWFSHDVSIEIAMQGIGAHKSGPKGSRIRVVKELLLFFEHKRCPHGGLWDPIRLGPANRPSG